MIALLVEPTANYCVISFYKKATIYPLDATIFYFAESGNSYFCKGFYFIRDRSQTLMVRSLLPVIKKLYSFRYRRQFTVSLCPFKVKSKSDLYTSQILTR